MLFSSLLATLTCAAVVMAIALFLKYRRPEPPQMSSGVNFATRSVIGFFSLTAAFLVVNADTALSDARSTTFAEAAALHEAYWAAGILPSGQRKLVRHHLREYAESVIYDEWPKLRKGQLDVRVQDPSDELRREVFTPVVGETGNQLQVRRQVAEQIGELYDARRARLAEAAVSVPPSVLLVLVGSSAVILFTLATAGRVNGLRELLILGCVAALLGFIVNLVFELNHPLAGDISVGTDAYSEVLERFRQIGL
ncbi:hypothetical protein ACFQ7B_43640 [Streptomyces erythrochromogenes]|uniref:bestrophin-like domain n=1 Tax=Streptomyces erythrochromogenes TaxID=285574 RepID=UPI0036748E95